MVVSNLDKTINYPEINKVHSNDVDHESYIYDARIYNKDVKFVIGQALLDYVEKNVVYFYIYLVKNYNVVYKIGLYETKNDTYPSLLDEDGKVIVEKLNDALIFSYAKKFIINKYFLESDKPISYSDSEADSDSDSDSEIDISKLDPETIAKLLHAHMIEEQTKEQSDTERKLFLETHKDDADNKWINKFMQSKKYNVVENEGGGDCLFAVLRDSLNTVGRNLSIKQIRKEMSREATEDLFEHYNELYNQFKGGQKASKKAVKECQQKHKVYKAKIGGTNDNTVAQQSLIGGAKKNLSEMETYSKVVQTAGALLDEFKFMENIDSLEKLKEFINTNDYWADEWAIATIEDIYKAKFIILSKTKFEDGEIENVVQCGQTTRILDELKKKGGVIQPKYYVIVEYSSDTHYRLVTYDKNENMKAFTFRELPYRIKELVAIKCMEKSGGIFDMIPDFKEFAESIGVKVGVSESDSLTTGVGEEVGADVAADVKLIDPPKSDLYGKSITIRIYHNSDDKPIGTSNKEHIDAEAKLLPHIMKLNEKGGKGGKEKKYRNWRKKLDNRWICDTLTIDGKKWPSVEHYMMASLFHSIKNELGEDYSKFMKAAEDTDFKAGEKLMNYLNLPKNKTLFAKMEAHKSSFLEKALLAKFTQNEDLVEILMLTGDALINVYKPYHGDSPATELMRVRKLLGKK